MIAACSVLLKPASEGRCPETRCISFRLIVILLWIWFWDAFTQDTQIDAVLDTCVRLLLSLLKGKTHLKQVEAGNIEVNKAIMEELLQNTDHSGGPVTRRDIDRIIDVEKTPCTESTQLGANMPLLMPTIRVAEVEEAPVPRLFHEGALFSSQSAISFIEQPALLQETPAAFAHEYN